MIGDSSHFLLIFLRIKANVSKNQIFEWWCCVKTCLNLFFQINLMWIENQLQLLKSPAGWIWAFKGSAELCSKSYPSATTPYWDQTLQLISRSIETNWDQLRSIEINWDQSVRPRWIGTLRPSTSPTAASTSNSFLLTSRCGNTNLQ